MVITVPTQKNYQRAYDEFEAELPMRPIYKSFQTITRPPWVFSEKLVNNRAEFLNITYRDSLVAIYKERQFGTGRMVYYVALSPTKYSLVFLVYEYRPTVKQIDNGFFKIAVKRSMSSFISLYSFSIFLRNLNKNPLSSMVISP